MSEDVKKGGHPYPVEERSPDKYPRNILTQEHGGFGHSNILVPDHEDGIAYFAHPYNKTTEKSYDMPAACFRGNHNVAKGVDSRQADNRFYFRCPRYFYERSKYMYLEYIYQDIVPHYFTQFREQLTTLAAYSRRCNNTGAAIEDLPEMTRKEKDALLLLIANAADCFFMPEMFTRFVNPTGVMSEQKPNRGLNHFFAALVELPYRHLAHLNGNKTERENARRFNGRKRANWTAQEHFNVSHPATTQYFNSYDNDTPGRKDALTAEQSRTLFYEYIEASYPGCGKLDPKKIGWNIKEPARLLGLAARQWGLDRPIAEVTNETIQENMKRFYYYVFAAKSLIVNDMQLAAELHIKDKEFILQYPDYVQSLKEKGKEPLSVEENLASKISAIRRDPTAKAKFLLTFNEVPNRAYSRIVNLRLQDEAAPAIEFLTADGMKGQKIAFSR